MSHKPQPKFKRITRYCRIALMLSICCFVVIQYALAQEPSTDESAEETRERIKKMKPEEKQQLQQRIEAFNKLPEEEKKRIRELHESVSKHPKCKDLKRVLHKYHSWLKTLPDSDRAELKSLKGEERIEKIRQLQKKTARATFS